MSKAQLSKRLAETRQRIARLEPLEAAQKQLEKRLNISEEKYRILFENSPDAIAHIDQDGMILTANHILATTLGISVSDLHGTHLSSLMPGEVIAQRMRAIKNALMQQQIQVFDDERQGRYFHTVIAPLSIPGHEDTVQVISRDITDHREAEEEVRRIAAIVDSIIDCIVVTDLEGRITRVNRAVIDQFGYPEREILGKAGNLFIAEQDQSRFHHDLGKLVSAHSIESAEYTILHRDGREIPRSISLSVMMDSKGMPEGIIVVLRNITEQKKAEEALRMNEKRFREFANSLPQVVYETDAMGRLTFVNKNAFEVFGYTEADLDAGFDPLQVFAVEDRERALHNLNKKVQGVPGAISEYTAMRKDGTTFPVMLHAMPIMNECECIGTRGLLVDITERKRAEAEIRAMNEELLAIQGELREMNLRLEEKVNERTQHIERLLKQKDDFVSQLGHDLKSPLTPIIALLPILAEREQDPKSRNLFDVIIRNAHYMKDLATKTLELARLNSSTLQLHKADVSLVATLNQVLQSKEAVFLANNIKVEARIEKNINVVVDELRFLELLENLISNAVKFTPDGGILIVEACTEGESITVAVKDTGIGISEEHISHIFDEFYKVDESRHDLDSSGLGLTICKRIVEKHGGKIWVESLGLGKGTSVYFTLASSNGNRQRTGNAEEEACSLLFCKEASDNE